MCYLLFREYYLKQLSFENNFQILFSFTRSFDLTQFVLCGRVPPEVCTPLAGDSRPLQRAFCKHNTNTPYITVIVLVGLAVYY